MATKEYKVLQRTHPIGTLITHLEHGEGTITGWREKDLTLRVTFFKQFTPNGGTIYSVEYLKPEDIIS